jgi:F-type H+-transporting ATPase subunit a
VTTLLAAVEYGGKWEVPPVEELFVFEPFALEDSTLFAFNRVALLVLTASIVAIAILWIGLGNPKLIPGKFQTACEAIVEFIREQIAIQVIGADGVRYVPLLLSIFMFVWINNLFEIIPFINFPPTSKIAIPMFLAIMVWILYIYLGIRAQGAGRYFKESIFPPSAPKALWPLIGPIEFVSNFITRPVTLTVRLFANMMAGHILLTLLFITAHAFLVLGPGLPVGIVGLVASPVMIGFEFVVGLLQAYIFTILAAVYIGSSLHPEH